MSNNRSAVASPSAETSAATIQSAFRDVTNHYLNANKENIPPAGSAAAGAFGNSYKKKGCALSAPPTNTKVMEVTEVCCGTPVESSLVGATAEVFPHSHERAAAFAKEEGNEEGEGLDGGAAYARLAATPLQSPTAANAHNAACEAAAVSLTSDSTVLSVARTPGHNAPHRPGSGAAATTTSTTTATKLQQQRHKSLSLAQGGEYSAATLSPTAAPSTPGPTRQRVPRVAHTVLNGSPLFTQSKPSNTTSPTLDASVTATAAAAPAAAAASQSSLHCTPSGARRSAAMAARVLGETPTRIDDFSFLLNNSFESGSESPMRDGVSGGYGSAMTPQRTYDLQMAVEEMLRGCLDNSTPAKKSDASGVSPHGSRKRQQHQLDATSTPPFSAYAALDAFLSTPAQSKTAAAAGAGGSSFWGQHFSLGANGTPERFVPPQTVFAESDEEEGGTSPHSDGHTREAPSAGVRRDPMVYFSTAAVSAVAAPAHVDCAAAPYLRDPMRSDEEAMAVAAAADYDAFHPHAVSARRTGGFEFHNDGSCSGPDMLAMLAAAVQQQQSPRSAAGSVEMNSQTFSDRDVESTLLPPPPSYDDGQPQPHQQQPPQSRYARREGAVSAGAACANGLPPTRRSHHLPQVKAAAGSLIAVSGRRVPVDKLHLLSLNTGEESSTSDGISPSATGAASRHPSRGGTGGRSNAQSPPTQQQQQHHVEGPSMRRVPKANVVTVTRAPAPVGAAGVVSGSRLVTATTMPTSSSHASLTDAPSARSGAAAAATLTTRVVVQGPSARRVPPSSHAGTALHARPIAVEGSGVRQTSECDVVAVLQFSKGQTMRFLTNLSPAALAEAQSLLRRDAEGRGDGRSSGGVGVPTLSTVEVGKSYLAHVYSDESPYENVPFEDVGVCVRLFTADTPAAGDVSYRDHVNGVLLREVDIFACEEDRAQHEQALQQQTAAYIECERQFKFSSLPFQLESIYFTFDGSVCVVFYRVVASDSATSSSSSSTAHRLSNTSRVARELQFHLSCRVFLKQC